MVSLPALDQNPVGDVDSAIRLEDVVKTYPGSAAPAVRDLSLEMPEGELVALVGPSGCGKTTTLKMINRLIEPTAGEIYVQGRAVTGMALHELRRGIGYVIQQIGLFPHRSIAANIATVPKLLGWSKDRIADRVHELSDLLHLDRDLLDRYPAALSGGQQQRVGVARALAADPPVLLMDEPYSAVDPIVRANLQNDLLDLQERLHKTIVLVTHDVDEAVKLADRIALLNEGGVLEQVGPPDELLRSPANEFVADFMGGERNLKRMALRTVADAVSDLDGAGADGDGSGPGGRGPEPGAPYAAVVRPQTSLRVALDTVIEADTREAVVLDDDDAYLGTIGIDDIARALM